MKTFLLVLFLSVFVTAQNYNIPYLLKKGDKTQLIVEDKPYLILGGEVRNSTFTSLEKLLLRCQVYKYKGMLSKSNKR